ncbi:MAG TPA: hypothetical protein VNY74_13650 [Edaphobacter sp.]|jgi:hypothetical protein|nr:hypothetical protein [Edaphobacter sp.]
MFLPMTPCRVSLRIVASATFLLAANGCVNLEDAAGLSKLSGEARISLPRVSNDVAGTCARQNTFFENTPQAERPATEQAQDCKPYQEIADHLAKDENVLADYFDALGKLASNQPLSYDATIDANVTATRLNPALSANTAAAGNDAQSILKSLADAATKGYREKQLGQLIQQNDAAIQSLTQALKKVITADYALLLSNEEVSLDTFYKGPMAGAQPTERLTLILVQRQYAHDKAALEFRKEDIAAYSKVMDDIASLHAKLKQDATKKISIVEIDKQVGPIIRSIINALSDIQSRSNKS